VARLPSAIFLALLALLLMVGLRYGTAPWLFGGMFAATLLAWIVAERAARRRVAKVQSTIAAQSEAIASLRSNLDVEAADKSAREREIHHRVSNNLQIIASLVNMRQRVLADPTAQAALNDLHDQIAALALTHRTLDKGPSVANVDMRDFLTSLIDEQIADRDGPDARVTVIVHAESLMIDADRLAPLALLAVEAISNVRKHALVLGRGVVRVDFSVVAARAVLSIADEGLADPPDLSHEGPGRLLMAGFARQLKGCLDVSVNDRGGVTVRLNFPVVGPATSETG